MDLHHKNICMLAEPRTVCALYRSSQWFGALKRMERVGLSKGKLKEHHVYFPSKSLHDNWPEM